MKKVLIIEDNNRNDYENSFSISEYLNNELKKEKINTYIVNSSRVINDNVFFRSIYDYTNIIVIASLAVGGISSSMMELMEKLLSEQSEEKKKIYFSVVINHNNKNKEYVEDALTLYKKFIKALDFQWQKGIGVNLGKYITSNEIFNLRTIYEPIIIELDLLSFDVKNNRSYNDYMIVEPYISRSLTKRINKLNICLEIIRDKWTHGVNSIKKAY